MHGNGKVSLHMSRIIYVNGRYVPHRAAMIHVEDRGLQFADGVYEVFPVFANRIHNLSQHLARLTDSLAALRISWPVTRAVLPMLVEQVRQRNRIVDGLIYLQITRGVAPRDHAFPRNPISPTLIISGRHIDMGSRSEKAAQGVQLISTPDQRWSRCDIKSVSLLANMLAKQTAAEQGAFEALMLDPEGYITEGAASSFWIVDQEGALVTRPLSQEILPGVTRQRVLDLAREAGIRVVERKIHLDELAKVREAFLTSATLFVMPVNQIDAVVIGNGGPGVVTDALRTQYIESLNFDTGGG